MAPRTTSQRLRRIANTTLAVLVAMAALLTAAYAATGSFPLQGALHKAPARAEVTQLSGPVARAGTSSVLFNATRLQPGLIRVAQIRIQNTGQTRGELTFTPTAVTDDPIGLPEPLSTVLDFVMEDATNRFRPVTLYVGKLNGIAPLALGTFNAGEARIYRFTVTYPTGRTPAQDNPLQGSSAAVRFDWDGVFDDVPAPPTPVPADETPATTTPTTTTPEQTFPVTPSGTKRALAPATLRVNWRARRMGGGLTAVVLCRRACTGTITGAVTSKSGPTVRLISTKVKLPKGKLRIYRLRYGVVDPAKTSAVLRGKGVVARVTLSVRTTAGTSRVRAASVLRTAR